MAKQIKLVKSLIGRKSDQIATAHSLGLKTVSYTHLDVYKRQRSHLIWKTEFHSDVQ